MGLVRRTLRRDLRGGLRVRRASDRAFGRLDAGDRKPDHYRAPPRPFRPSRVEDRTDELDEDSGCRLRVLRRDARAPRLKFGDSLLFRRHPDGDGHDDPAGGRLADLDPIGGHQFAGFERKGCPRLGHAAERHLLDRLASGRVHDGCDDCHGAALAAGEARCPVGAVRTPMMPTEEDH